MNEEQDSILSDSVEPRITYRTLEKGEITQEGDEFQDTYGGWRALPSWCVGYAAYSSYCCRRKVNK